MTRSEWVLSPEFKTIWKDAFAGIKQMFSAFSKDISVVSKRERTGSLWTQVKQPYPGIHLIAIELQPDISPLTIRLKIWVNKKYQQIYDNLRSQDPPKILDQPTYLNPDQKPRSSWEANLRKQDISLIGLSYRLSDLSFLDEASTARISLASIGNQFSSWVIDNIQPDATQLSNSEEVSSEGEENPKDIDYPEVTFPDEIADDVDYPEGSKNTVTVNAYERSAVARRKCIEHYGYQCIVCEVDFEKKYGEIGKHFIHVHHEIPLSEIKRQYSVNPILDLKPVCPNCHAMLHRTTPALSVETLREVLNIT